jgi:RNA polymerase sigma-70 factor (ECF subfamily)
LAEAEDVVQDAWLRWHTTDRTRVVHATAFLVTTTTRLAINTLQSARLRHDLYVHRWSPEPVAATHDPERELERRDEIVGVLTVLLERLPPAERGAYLLRHGFGYSYSRLAAVLNTSEANARQLVSRAGRHVAEERRRTDDELLCAPLADAFASAAEHGDLRSLEELLVQAA